MGTLKDIVDLTTQLSESVSDRKFVGDVQKIQNLTLKLQAEQTSLHERNIQLREECLGLKEEIIRLKGELQNSFSAPGIAVEGVPSCPNCSTAKKLFYMRAVGEDFMDILNATHQCPKCKYTTNI